jgi:hypothetical protein
MPLDDTSGALSLSAEADMERAMDADQKAKFATKLFAENHRKSAESIEGTMRFMDIVDKAMPVAPGKAKQMADGLREITAREAAFHREMAAAYERVAEGLPPFAVVEGGAS